MFRDLNLPKRIIKMKKEIHPDYHAVVFKDSNNDFAYLGKSTQSSNKTITWEDGKEYPLITLGISSASHPFYTGKQTNADLEGRIDAFKRRYGKNN